MTEVHPEVLDLYIGGYTGDTFRVTWRDGSIEYAHYGYGFSPPTTVTVRPTRAQWQRFWEKLESYGTWEWPEECEANVEITDGTSWSIELAHGGKRLISGGSNAYPGTSGPEPSPAFRKYLAAVRRLLGGLDFR